MKVAAIQLNAVFADVEANMNSIVQYVKKASSEGIELLVLPEFFTSAMGFSEKMLQVAACNIGVKESLSELSEQYNIIIGGSLLTYDSGDVYNSFYLIFPDGKSYQHKKDLPTQFENCYYTKGDTGNVLHTPIGDIGVALCWEMIRYDTLKRLAGKVDLILAGSCWWDLPDNAPPDRDSLRQYNHKLADETPVELARLLHVPVIHANHCGKIDVLSFPDGDKQQSRQFVGSAQIINGNGKVIAKRSFDKGEGMVSATLNWNTGDKNSLSIETEQYWVPELPASYIDAWKKNNYLGKAYYEKITQPYYKKIFITKIK